MPTVRPENAVRARHSVAIPTPTATNEPITIPPSVPLAAYEPTTRATKTTAATP
jgi:hypothetical protein